MKKIIITLTLLVFSTMSAHALDRSSFSALSVTGGIAATQGLFGAKATETNRSDTNVITHVKSENGVFTDTYTSGFIELNMGQWVSVGYEHTPDSITTPTNSSRESSINTGPTSNVSVDFNDMDTLYIKLNLGQSGFFGKFGQVKTDATVKKTGNSTSTYNNFDLEGSVVGIGYENSIRDSRIGIRFETSYMDFDNPKSSSNGVAADGATVANGGQNIINAKNVEGLQGKVALTLTLGRDSN